MFYVQKLRWRIEDTIYHAGLVADGVKLEPFCSFSFKGIEEEQIMLQFVGSIKVGPDWLLLPRTSINEYIHSYLLLVDKSAGTTVSELGQTFAAPDEIVLPSGGRI
jgi:hypothetical protein